MQLAAAAACSCLAGCALPTVAEQRRIEKKAVDGSLARTTFGGLHRLGDGVYAFVATPFDSRGGKGDRRAHSNSGIIVGDEGILVVDALRTPGASAWLVAACHALTGRRPTHLVCTHFHFDHVGGVAGFVHQGKLPRVYQTRRTRDLVRDSYGEVVPKGEQGLLAQSSLQAFGGHYVEPTDIVIDGTEGLRIDLGRRTVNIREVSGHTESDLVVEVEDPRVVFTGDLVWNGIFPNFMSAHPERLGIAVRSLFQGEKRLMVPGHGLVGATDDDSLKNYADLLDAVELAAKQAYAKGIPAEQAGGSFQIPESLGAWKYFRPGFHETAFRKWYELLQEKG